MSVGDVSGVIAIGFAAGMLGGVIGVGGGVLMVPGLVLFLDESQLHAEATSLLAIIIVAGVGAWRQRGYGNVRGADALLIGVLSLLGVGAGAVLANSVSDRVLELAFAGFQLYIAAVLVKRALQRPQADSLTRQ